jgi:hypothetical protein
MQSVDMAVSKSVSSGFESLASHHARLAQLEDASALEAEFSRFESEAGHQFTEDGAQGAKQS